MVDDIFGFIPNNIELYKLALIHRSASLEVEGRTINNERLEFLGDAVIEAVTSDYLFIEYPNFNEGGLTKLRSKIVSRQSLNNISEQIGLAKNIICNQTIPAQQKHIYGDAFEAMMGAIYLDQGYDFVNRLLINDIYAREFTLEEINESETDFKSRLIEWGQKSHHSVIFKCRNMAKSGDTPQFACTVKIGNFVAGHGFGSSKKEAEQRAAESVACEDFSDEQSMKLLEMIDKVDSPEKPQQPQARRKPGGRQRKPNGEMNETASEK